ncbi:hypothetical protein QTO34_006222 [Cnephaeus nilssonii]|uniref:FXYD domain-containing ion transport regulator n=1 Tax=Cnephaeus nilssonii TaxID=3371016 RepID=A0AA40HM99_CNENI|nr:hypothetical protein QTO34_006222 [Eptesicus nilssonii]
MITQILCFSHPGLPALEANDLIDKDSSFSYDWEALQLGGTICAALLCIAGILFALSEPWGWRDGAEGGHVRSGGPRVPMPFALMSLPLTGGKCKCKHNRKHSPLAEKAVPLITSGSASTC